MDAATAAATAANNNLAREFFELGEAFAHSQTAFSSVRHQVKIFRGGEFDGVCFEIKEKYRALRSLSGERLEAAQVRKDLVKADKDLHLLLSDVASASLVNKQAGYDVAG